MASSRINNIFQRFKVLKNNKRSLNSLFQLISEYVYNRKYDGQDIPNAGIFADEDIYDNTAQRANGIMARGSPLWIPRTILKYPV